MSWALFWKLILIFCLSAYSLLVVVVIFGGIGNIIDMLKELSTPRDQE
jgi:lipoprotein signal peptidase